MSGPHIFEINGAEPSVGSTAWIAPTATLIGSVRLHDSVSVWYGSVLRADSDSIEIGSGSNIQDGVAVHVDPGFPVRVGSGVSVGHNAVLHGCTVEDGALIGMGAVILNGAVVGEGALVAASALVLEGTIIPPRSLAAGVPAKVRRELTDEEVASTVANAQSYRGLSATHAAAVPVTGSLETAIS
jgi:carbonic anhydrase/acetyltransferase-like protein (isoleucine patch superfamily)